MKIYPRQNVALFAYEYMNSLNSRWYLSKANSLGHQINYMYRLKDRTSLDVLQDEDMFYSEIYPNDVDSVAVWSGRFNVFQVGRQNFGTHDLKDIGQFVAFEHDPINFDYDYSKHHR